MTNSRIGRRYSGKYKYFWKRYLFAYVYKHYVSTVMIKNIIDNNLKAPQIATIIYSN